MAQSKQNTPRQEPQKARDLFVVGLGASAGGLEAL